MDKLYFDHEFTFNYGIFDENIYNQCVINDITGTRLQDVKNVILEIQKIFIQMPGLNIFSTFLQQDKYRYKITLNNTK